MGNENDKTTLGTQVNVKVSGINNLDALNARLDTTDEQLKTIVKHLDELEKKTKRSGKSLINLGGKTFELGNSKEDRALKGTLNKKIQEAQEAELKAIEANTNALNVKTEKDKEITKKLEKQNQNYNKNQETKNRNSITRQLEAENQKNKNEDLAGWRRFKSENPREFLSRTTGKRYVVGSALNQIGDTISRYGVGGRLSGDLMSVIGTGIKQTPFAGAMVGLTKLVQGIAELGKASLQAYSEIETLKTGLSIISPTQVQADTLFRDVAGYATRSPFGVAQSTELVTLLKQSGVSDSELMSTLTMLGDTAGGNMEKLKRIANNYAQIVSIGKASMLDMRQFAYAGIPIFEAVSKELGVTQQALREMISDGKVTSDVIEKVFKDLTSSNGIFANATAIGAKTFAARKQNLADTKQLALSAMGERFVNFGSGMGKNLQNEGLGKGLLSFSESFYEAIQRWYDGKLLQKAINNIEKKNTRVQELSALITYHESVGNDEIVKQLKEELKQVYAFSSIDEDRAKLNEKYESLTNDYKELLKIAPENFDLNSISKSFIKNEIKSSKSIFDQMSRLSNYSVNLSQGSIEHYSKAYGPEVASLLQDGYSFEEIAKRYESEIAFWERALEIKNNLKKITEEMEQANKETLTVMSQQSIADKVSSSNSATGSVFNIASQMMQAYKNTDEYKQDELAKQTKLWEDVKQILLDIRKIENQQGFIDFSKLSPEDFAKYISKGALVVEEELDVISGKKTEQKISNRRELSNQYVSAISSVEKYMSQNNIDNETISEALKLFTRNGVVYSKSTEEFFKNFSSTHSQTIKILEEEINNEKNKELKGVYALIKEFIEGATIKFSADTEAADLDPNTLLSGSGKEFIPLWKRLLAGATGLSANVISGTNSALEMYRDDLAIRNTTSGVLRAGLQSGLGVDFVQSLLKTSGSTLELRGDKGGTYQIDWQATGKAVKEFAMQLSASTKVISAYRSGLEAQLNTYETLLSEALTSAESQDIKSGKKYATSAQLSQMAKDYGDQLVNAFGEMLTTKDGLQVTVKDGEFYDVNGNKIAQENVIVTGNIYKFMEDELPKIRAELNEIRQQEIKNGISEEIIKKSQGNTVVKSVVDELLSNEFSRKILSITSFNDILSIAPDKIQELFDISLTTEKGSVIEADLDKGEIWDKQKYPNFSTKSTEDIFSAYYDGDTEAKQLLETTAKRLVQALADFTSTSGFQASLEKAKETEREAELTNARLLFASDDTSSSGSSSSGKFKLSKAVSESWKNSNDANLNGGFLHSWLYSDLLSNVSGADGKPVDLSSFSLSDISLENGLSEDAIKAQLAIENMSNALKEAKQGIIDLSKTTLSKAFLAPFETLGENIFDLSNYSKDLSEVYANLGADLMSSLGPLVTSVGLEIAKSAAATGNWGLVAGGLALAATGGVLSGLGTAIKNKQDATDKNDSEYERLEAIKDDLSKILEQARKDAAYYENNMRHKNALGMNEKFSYRSVNDAIITPSGNVVTTHPEDYLIATKNPQNLAGGSSQPIINNIVNNNAGVQVKQEQKVNADGSIDIITTLEAVVGDYISSSKSDDAFNAREFRLNGHRAVM